jgi:hypothetical protein
MHEKRMLNLQGFVPKFRDCRIGNREGVGKRKVLSRE